jgi:hypothetical protein
MLSVITPIKAGVDLTHLTEMVTSLMTPSVMEIEWLVGAHPGDWRGALIDWHVVAGLAARAGVRFRLLATSTPNVARVRNDLLALATGDVVAQVDTDDIYPPGAMDDLVARLRNSRSPEVCGVFGRAEDFDSATGRTTFVPPAWWMDFGQDTVEQVATAGQMAERRRAIRDALPKDEVRPAGCYPIMTTAGAMWTYCVRAAGGWDETAPLDGRFSEDALMMARLQRDYSIALAPDVLALGCRTNPTGIQTPPTPPRIDWTALDAKLTQIEDAPYGERWDR